MKLAEDMTFSCGMISTPSAEMTKQELLEKLKDLYVCDAAQEWAVAQPNIETILKDCPHDWRLWALRKGLLEFAKHCNWDKLNGYTWSTLLQYQPQFAVHCNWNKLKDNDWVSLFRKQPQLTEQCKWNNLNGWNWPILLKQCPQFKEYYNPDKL